MEAVTLKPSLCRAIPITEEALSVRCPRCGLTATLTEMEIVTDDEAAEVPYLRLTILCEGRTAVVTTRGRAVLATGCDQYHTLVFVPTAWTGTACPELGTRIAADDGGNGFQASASRTPSGAGKSRRQTRPTARPSAPLDEGGSLRSGQEVR